MSSHATPRRDQRRRLVLSWSRAPARPAAAAAADAARSMAAYDPQALPERQPGPALLLPTGAGSMALAVTGILVPVGAAVALSAAEQFLGRSPWGGSGRFARTLAAAAACFDPRSVASLQVWLGDMLLVAAAGVALVVRLMRRHRRDDYKGRYRGWGWLAGLLMGAALAGVVPIGTVVGALLTDATGIALGPGGIGWWHLFAAAAFTTVALWTVMPLHERAATAACLALVFAAWSGSAVATWLAAGRAAWIVAAQATWTLGAALMAITMLVAARSVIREVRGACRPGGGTTARNSRPAAVEAQRPPPRDDDQVRRSVEADQDRMATVYVDGSEDEPRHLSKAERKRLRKLARMNAAA